MSGNSEPLPIAEKGACYREANECRPRLSLPRRGKAAPRRETPEMAAPPMRVRGAAKDSPITPILLAQDVLADITEPYGSVFREPS
jgi:hypothetical protein